MVTLTRVRGLGSSTRKARVLTFATCTLAGIAIGVSGDFMARDVPVDLGSIMAAVVLSPLAIPIAGKVVTVHALSNMFAIGGLLFWPVYAVIGWFWFRRTIPWGWIVILAWSAQGFFQVVHRLHVIMSV